MQPVPKEKIGDGVKYLKDGLQVTALSHAGEIINIELPITIEATVVETSRDEKGNTASGGSKPAKIETGAVVQVPFFINVGDRIKVDTRSGEYLGDVRTDSSPRAHRGYWMVTQQTRNRLSMLSAQATGLGLKVGIPIAAVAAVYLLYVAFGDTVRHFDTMSAADRQYLAASVKNVGLVLQWTSVAIALSLVVRFFFTQAVGLPMTLGGALIYFGVPMLFGNIAPSLSKSAESVAAEAVAGLCRAGVIFLALESGSRCETASSDLGRDIGQPPGRTQAVGQGGKTPHAQHETVDSMLGKRLLPGSRARCLPGVCEQEIVLAAEDGLPLR